VLLTRSPLGHSPEGKASLDLHVLSTPPAFVLSQDQTLRECLYDYAQQAGFVDTESHRLGDGFNHWSIRVWSFTSEVEVSYSCSMYQKESLQSHV
jgi:hypothetical protein